MQDRDAALDNFRTMVERINARLNGEFGGKFAGGRGAIEVKCHLMFDSPLACDPIFRASAG